MVKLFQYLTRYKAYVFIVLLIIVVSFQKNNLQSTTNKLSLKNAIISNLNEVINYYESSLEFSIDILTNNYGLLRFYDSNITKIDIHDFLIDNLTIFIQLDMSDSNFEWYLKYFLEREEERFTNNEIKLIIICAKIESSRNIISGRIDGSQVLLIETGGVSMKSNSSSLIGLDKNAKVQYSLLLSPHMLYLTHNILEKFHTNSN